MYSRFFRVFVKLKPAKPLLKLDPSKQRRTGDVLERSWRPDLPVGLGSGGDPGAFLDRQETGTPRGNGQVWLRRGHSGGSNLSLSLLAGPGAGLRRARQFYQT